MSLTVRDRYERPLRDLRVSVTDRCNFRCPYCMPAEKFGHDYVFMPKDQILDFEEILRVLTLVVPLGVRKLRLTGGEPLLRHGLHELIRGARQIPGIEDIALTTNGTLLGRMAGQLRREGLSRLTVSLDSLDPEVFSIMNGGRLSLDHVLGGIAAAEEAGFTGIKINCVVQKGVNDHAIVDLARHFQGSGHIVRFIEYMDVGTRNGWKLDEVLTAQEILDRIDQSMPLEPMDSNYVGEVARRYRYRDGSGEIGVITSVSQPFCGDCSRARLTTDGRLVTCLFASRGTDLRTLLRDGTSDEVLSARIREIWQGRDDRYSEERAGLAGEEADDDSPSSTRRVEMYEVGG
ncbi:MAG: GTP 3',8-cyclase MoaA [Myxococcota bacterium]|nr:GTP 3',8-cyclase MoaA [Myxococcota bacterium]